ncbi:TPA: metallophosphoesterase [Proteus mirabilis]
MKKHLSIFILLSIFIPISYAGNLVKVNILATSDIHSYININDYYNDVKSEKYGLISLVNTIESFRQNNNNTYLVDIGDLLSGNPLGDHIINRYQKDKNYYTISPIICSLNTLNYDVVTLGNHDFDNGIEFLTWSYSKANFPIVLSNVIDAKSKQTIYPDTVIKQVEVLDDIGKKHLLNIAYIGLVPMQTMHFNKNRLENKVIFIDLLKAANNAAIKAKKEGADLVIALSHSGIDISPPIDGMENVAFYLAQNPNIDGILFGHTHETFPSDKNLHHQNINNSVGLIFNKPTAQPGKWGGSVAAISFILEKDNNTWVIKESKGYQLAKNDKPIANDINHKISSCIANAEQDLKSELEKEVSADSFNVDNYFNLIGNEKLTTLLADSIRYYMKDYINHDEKLLISISPSYSLNDASFFVDINNRKITNKDLSKIFYPANLTALKVNKQQLIEWLEMSTNIYNSPTENTNNLINKDSHSYLFYPILGLTYDVNISKTPLFDLNGKKNEHVTEGRVSNLRYNNQEITDADTFIIVASKFAPYFQKHKESLFLELGNEKNIDIFRNYIATHQINSETKNNYRLIADYPVTMDLVLPNKEDKSAYFLWHNQYPLTLKSQTDNSVRYQIRITP